MKRILFWLQWLEIVLFGLSVFVPLDRWLCIICFALFLVIQLIIWLSMSSVLDSIQFVGECLKEVIEILSVPNSTLESIQEKLSMFNRKFITRQMRRYIHCTSSPQVIIPPVYIHPNGSASTTTTANDSSMSSNDHHVINVSVNQDLQEAFEQLRTEEEQGDNQFNHTSRCWDSFHIYVAEHIGIWTICHANTLLLTAHIACHRLHTKEKAAREVECKAKTTAMSKKDTMTRYLFHEIRVPLQTMALSLETLLSHSQLTNEIKESVDLIHQQYQSLTVILSDILSLQKIADGKLSLEFKPFSLHELILSTVRMFRKACQDKNIKITSQLASVHEFALGSNHINGQMNDCKVDCLGDQNRLRQILSNFMSNALKFTPVNGSWHIELTILSNDQPIQRRRRSSILKPNSSLNNVNDFDCIVPGQIAEQSAGLIVEPLQCISEQVGLLQHNSAIFRISVRDTGVGVDPKRVHELFQPYMQILPGDQQQGGGTGLGLSICKSIIELHGGEIGYEPPTDGHSGSCFFITVPMKMRKRAVQPSLALTVHQKSNSIEFYNVENKRILVAEDNITNRKLLMNLLVKNKFQVVGAEDGLQVLKLINEQQQHVDAIVMDGHMPNLNGYETTKRLRNMGIKVPIIAVTGNALDVDRSLFMDAGANDFLSKPIDIKELIYLFKKHCI